MAVPDPLAQYRVVADGSGYPAFGQPNVVALDPGDVRALDHLFVDWTRVRRRLAEVRGETTCAVCRVTFVGDACERCGIRRRSRA